MRHEPSLEPAVPLSADDAARLHMAVRTNPMVIVAVLVLAAPPDEQRLVEALESRLPARFRRRIVDSRFGVARWADTGFAARAHVTWVAPGDRSLEAIVHEVMNAPLRRDRPLWDIHLVGGERPALLFRAHHALADGARLLEVLGLLGDGQPTPRAERGAARGRARLGLPLRAWHLVRGLRGAASLALRKPDPDSPLHVRLRGRKRVALSNAMDLAGVVERAHRAGASTMASMLAAVAGALHHAMRFAPELTLHALVPVPTAAVPGEAGNRFASVFVPLPVGEVERDERVRAIQRALSSARRRAPAAARIVEAAGVATAAIERAGVRALSRRASLMVSNVRGPEQRIRIAGALVTDMVAFAPSAGRIALGVTFMSYAGRLRAAVAIDASVAADPRVLAERIAAELAPASGRA